MTDLKQKTDHFLALADAATPGPWAVHPSRAVVVPSPHASRPIGCHENPVIDLETYAQEICALHWPDRNRNESEVRSNANLIAAVPDMATHLRALQAEVDRMRGALIEAIKLPLPEADQQTASNYGICNDCYSREALEDYARAIIDAAINRERGE